MTSFWQLVQKTYDEDAFWVGTCRPSDKWPFCSASCNLMEPGGECKSNSCAKGKQARVAISCKGRGNNTVSFLLCHKVDLHIPPVLKVAKLDKNKCKVIVCT